MNKPDPIVEVLLSSGDAVIKLSSILAINYVRGRSHVYLKGGRYIEIHQSRGQHKALIENYQTMLAEVLPSKQNENCNK